MTHNKRTHQIDIHVGEQIRQRRKSNGLSRNALAKAIGVSNQQIQKYEVGANRISAGKLWVFAGLLNCSIEDFYLGYEGGEMDYIPPRYSKQQIQYMESIRWLPTPVQKQLVSLCRSVAQELEG